MAVSTSSFAAHTPIPADGGFDVALDSSLSWTAGVSSQAYDIYFGTDPSEVSDAVNLQPDLNRDGWVTILDLTELSGFWLQSDNTTTAWSDINHDGITNIEDFSVIAEHYGLSVSQAYKGRILTTSYQPGTLDYDTQYYWRVDEVTPTGVVKGDLWSFFSEVDAHIPDMLLTFSDEFNGTAVDEVKWRYRQGDDSRPYIKSYQTSANNAVSDGLYRCILKKETMGTKQFTAGGIISRDTRRYGYYESRFKCPPTAGWHTSFWMNTQDTSVSAIEIDVFESDSINLYSYFSNLHRNIPLPKLHFPKTFSAPNLNTSFHVLGCEFTPTHLRYFFNGTLMYVIDATQVPHSDQQIWLTSIGLVYDHQPPIDESQLPVEAQYDYVRVYEFLKAFGPIPVDNAAPVLQPVELIWEKGALAAEVDGQEVYFGTDHTAVLNADTNSPEYQGAQSSNNFNPAALDPGVTYYWRIDQVNGSDIWKGNVWQFRTWQPGEGILIDPATLAASAFNTTVWGDRQPEYAVDSSGLTDDAHTNDVNGNMWMADSTAGWFKIDLGQSYELNSLKLWNFNMAGYTNRGIQQADIYYSNSSTDPGNPTDNPGNWTLLSTETFSQASGRNDYGTNTDFNMPNTVDMTGATAQWIALDINTNHGDPGYTGISEIQAFREY